MRSRCSLIGPLPPDGSPCRGRSRSVLAELAPQVADVDVDDVGAGVEVVAPDVLEQLLAARAPGRGGGRTSRRARTRGRSARRCRPPTIDPARAQVERRVADAQDGRLGARVAAQPHPHAREQLLEAERLRDVVVGAALEARRPCRATLVAGREDDDRQPLRRARAARAAPSKPSCPGSPRSRITRSKCRVRASATASRAVVATGGREAARPQALLEERGDAAARPRR